MLKYQFLFYEINSIYLIIVASKMIVYIYSKNYKNMQTVAA